MIKVDKIYWTDPLAMEAKVDLQCDDVSEITDSLTSDDIKGMPKDHKIAFGSTFIDTAFNVGMMRSDGTWNKG